MYFTPKGRQLTLLKIFLTNCFIRNSTLISSRIINNTSLRNFEFFLNVNLAFGGIAYYSQYSFSNSVIFAFPDKFTFTFNIF